MWLGQNGAGVGIVVRASGYTPVRVSTHAVEYAFRAGPSVGSSQGSAEGCTYQQDGHTFYELNDPVLHVTFVYDTTEGLWHERGRWDGLDFDEMDTRGYFGGFTLGTDGEDIVRERRAPHINIAHRRIRYSRLRLVMETGLGSGSVASTDPAFDPLMTLSWSNDGGQTFGADFPISTGRIGAYSQLVEWFQLEQAQDRVFKFRTSSPTPQRLVDAFLDYTIGPT